MGKKPLVHQPSYHFEELAVVFQNVTCHHHQNIIYNFTSVPDLT